MLSVKSSRKASLDLSVNSIVVMVIAFVVLGLILTFTRGIFSFGQGQLSQIQNVVDLAEKPDSGNPIVPRSMNLETIAGQKISMGFYNTGSTSLSSVELEFKDCIGTKSDGNSFTGTRREKPYREEKSSRIHQYQLCRPTRCDAPAHGRIAPSAIDKFIFGITRDGSTSSVAPRPVHSEHAP